MSPSSSVSHLMRSSACVLAARCLDNGPCTTLVFVSSVVGFAGADEPADGSARTGSTRGLARRLTARNAPETCARAPDAVRGRLLTPLCCSCCCVRCCCCSGTQSSSMTCGFNGEEGCRLCGVPMCGRLAWLMLRSVPDACVHARDAVCCHAAFLLTSANGARRSFTKLAVAMTSSHGTS